MFDAPAKELDHGFQVGRRERGVVEDGVEVVAMGGQRGFELAGHPPISVDSARPVRQRGLVAVDDGHLVAAASQLEDEIASDVTIAAGDQNSHIAYSPGSARR